MKLIGAGLPRTGTLSQKVALEMLGLAPCYHMVNVLMDLDELPPWRRGFDGEGRWQELLGDFQAIVDWPGAYFYRELMEAYPDAKVLLSVRDGDSWERSMRETIWGTIWGDSLIHDVSNARCRVDPKWNAYIELMSAMWQRSGLISDPYAPPGEMARAIERYHAEVQQNVPPERLLVWSVGEGWEPLCRFLELPVPSVPFPHLNDSKDYNERITDGAILALQEWRAQDAPPVHAT